MDTLRISQNPKNTLPLIIGSKFIIENLGSGARSARRLNFNHGYVDLQSGDSARRYYVRDHLGSVRAVVNDGGTTLESDDYYPLGGPLPSATALIQPEKY